MHPPTYITSHHLPRADFAAFTLALSCAGGCLKVTSLPLLLLTAVCIQYGRYDEVIFIPILHSSGRRLVSVRSLLTSMPRGAREDVGGAVTVVVVAKL